MRLVWIFLGIVATVFINECNALVAYDCNVGDLSMTSISLITTPECLTTTPNITTEKVNVAVTQGSSISNGRFISCLFEATSVISRCGATIDTRFESGLFTDIIALSSGECKGAHETGEVKIRYISTEVLVSLNAKGSFSFESHGYIRQGSCTAGTPYVRNGINYDKPVITTNIQHSLARGEISIDYEKNLVTFPNGDTCKYTDGSCYTANYGNSFWEVKSPKCSEGHKILVYSGIGEIIKDLDNKESYIQVNHDGYDFQILLTTKKTYVCGYSSYRTEHPNLYVTIIDSSSPEFPIKSRGNIKELSLMNYLNSKLVYAMRHTKREVDRLFSVFSKDRCETRNKISRNMMSIAMLSPMEFAFTYGGPGHTAIARGEVIYLAKCSPTSVIPDVNRTGCYNEIPVINDNKMQFMSPRSRILVNIGTMIDCLPDMPPLYLLGEDWYQISSRGLIRHSKPATMQQDDVNYEFSVLSGLGNGGLYNDETIALYQEALVSGITSEIVKTRVADSIGGRSDLPTGYSVIKAMSDGDYNIIESKIGGFWTRFKSNAINSGSWFGFILLLFAVWKMLIYSVSCFVNFVGIKEEVGLLLAIPICFFESISNMILHGKIKTRKQGKSNEHRSDFLELGEIEKESGLPILMGRNSKEVEQL